MHTRTGRRTRPTRAGYPRTVLLRRVRKRRPIKNLATQAHEMEMSKRLSRRVWWIGLATVLAMAIILASLPTKQEEPVPDNPAAWPATVREAVQDFLSHAPFLTKARIRFTARDDLILFHHNLGMAIRNRYGLWRGNNPLILSACSSMCHPDDASMVIIEAIWLELNSGNPPKR